VLWYFKLGKTREHWKHFKINKENKEGFEGKLKNSVLISNIV